MKKRNKISTWIIALFFVSLLLTIAEGILFYSEHIKQPVFYVTLILENCVHTFTNDANITISDAIGALESNPGIVPFLISIAYSISILVAPVCTLAAIYKVLETLLKFRFNLFGNKNKEGITIFGYNENVRALLKKELDSPEAEKRKIRVVSSETLSEEDEKLFYSCQAVHYEFDIFEASPNEMKKKLKDLKTEQTEYIILYDEFSTKNFSLFYAFYNNIKLFHENVKFYCYCEDDEVHDILEDYYNALPDKPDLELFSINELRVRKVYEKTPLHSVYLKKEKVMNEKIPVEKWHLHMVIIGLGKLGQQMLLQAMSQGVVHSKTDMLFDVIDCNMEEQKALFANHFSSLYVDMSNENEWRIENPKADGKLVIRFHTTDVRMKNFQNVMMQVCETLPPTYIAVCITDEKNSLHCMLEVEKYLRRHELDSVPVGVRMENNERMSEFLTFDNEKHKNVFIIEDIKNAISLDDMLSKDLNKVAKVNHYLYQKLNMVCDAKHVMQEDETEYMSSQVIKAERKIEKDWCGLKLFKRDSNRAASMHLSVKKDILQRQSISYEKMWNDYFGRNGKIRKQSSEWVFSGTNEELNTFITSDSFLNEMAMMEHRRWCYFMASKGWKAKYELEGRKEEAKINPCMVDWQGLLANETLQEYCKYDLQSLLFILNQWKEKQDIT